MCGLSGILSLKRHNSGKLRSVCRAMTDQLRHRGPDDSGVWEDPESSFVMGHRRLSVIDLSPGGHQPMVSPCGRFTIAYNGEVYNFGALRKTLQSAGYNFQGNSDTEVILAAIGEWGLTKAVRHLVGMFAFALWDSKKKSLCLVRDRLGKKPLYYGWIKDCFVFASELKALRAHPEFQNPVDRNVLCTYFRHSYIPSPYSIHQHVWQMEPGTILSLNQRNMAKLQGKRPESNAYWSLPDIWEQGRDNFFEGDENDAVETLDDLLRSTVKCRMAADVPLGAFLSGGVDSSTVVALMQAQSLRPVRTFSIGFHESEKNEAHHARAIADHLHTSHTELYVTPQDARDVIPEIPQYWDEPFADPSQIPTYLLALLTKEHVTVALSGDGGDELFVGYRKHFLASEYWNMQRRIPEALRRIAEFQRYIPENSYRIFGRAGQKIKRRIEALNINDLHLLYQYFRSHQKRPAELVKHAHELETPFTRIPPLGGTDDPFRYMSGIDLTTYLPNDILTKVDRATMATSLEARTPLLDHRIVEFAARLPHRMKVKSGNGKWILRQVLQRYVPEHLFKRPKMGFGIPIEQWLRNELRDWSENLIDEKKIESQGYLDPEPIRKMWTGYLAGQPWHYYLWDVLMFQAWLEKWESGD
ncbi:MAG: asparagine synthase (glutamine-hydrolyzing) [Gammaproteobacteria bacterium]|nr:asparagine synthase (glutamine-hydrolyzing) [Gammaproteobacteria bacterium]